MGICQWASPGSPSAPPLWQPLAHHIWDLEWVVSLPRELRFLLGQWGAWTCLAPCSPVTQGSWSVSPMPRGYKGHRYPWAPAVVAILRLRSGALPSLFAC